MKRIVLITFLLLLTLVETTLAAPSKVSQEPPPALELVTTSDYQWTGLAISSTGRIFVSFPAWGRHPGFHVGEVIGETVVPLGGIDQSAFRCVESVVSGDRTAVGGRAAAGGVTTPIGMATHGRDTLWILDSGRPDGEAAADGGTFMGAKLVMLDLASNKIVRDYPLGSVCLPDSRMEDVRVDAAKGFAYITDSGHGGIVVLDLTTGDAWRALTDIGEVRANITGIYFQHTGFFSGLSHSNGLELSKDGATLYFSAEGSDVLYKVPTAVLTDASMTVETRQKSIQAINVQNVPSDGMTLRNTCLYMGDLSTEGIWEFDLSETNVAEAGAILNLGIDVRWASALAPGGEDDIYFITSAINYPPEEQPPYELYHMKWLSKKSSRSTNIYDPE